ncbi:MULTISPECIES: acyl CoA:acetate/3-ketoacid CoA transferase [Ralstonia solanacearum species complex]|uniref:Acetate CoA-transferase YdiF n=1 Tax=Ralstonia solanacearum K60 TaxID=1091042 RepID=A0AAP8D3M5_RALSL|nr:acyl CoA:acetate/3-ketoacid CoA transferase [Ralstonia solanacearum]OYQ12862.1 acyl CoA:acetate/3-ketoacid CoA transferase [Ralstonia solanacearum K60]QOK83206.1 acyl CoA:acetate/3-ketoacid CoA transferase [Ralstonia solanacearum]RIJ87334.1 acyl CoA:acetate/3-ketoacid CoA transferase [Ralstonia solanacearum]CCF97195.1 putative CoA TRANSFERASE; exported protein [Ralstonia solanacearum K60]
MQVITAEEAARLVQPGWTVACAGFVGAGHAEAVTHALERRFLATGEPRDLTLVYSAGQGDRATRGVNHFGNPGMTRCVVGGHWRSATRLAALALAEQCEAFNLPQGVLTHLYRAIAGGKPGVLTRVGLHTFVDPRTSLDARYQGAAINARARAARAAGTASWVEYERFRGEAYLFYPRFPLHCVLLRGTAADPRGNISTHEEAFHHELLAMAQAARNAGGIVIAQVRRLVDRHDNLQAVHVPGILVDDVVVAEDPAEHQMTFGEAFNPAYLRPWQGELIQLREDALEAGAALEASLHGTLYARTLVQRRAVLELMAQRPRVVNLGVGMPAAVGVLAEQEGARGFTLTVEAGPIGGTPADGLSFGASAYPEAVVDQPAQFDFYEGGGIDLAILGLAELDGQGNVNVSLFGEGGDTIVAGVGGFINITQSARALVFMGTLTAGGLQVEAGEGRLRIVREGRLKKIVPAVSHLTFNGEYAARSGIPVRYVTERAVFEMRGDGHGGRRLTLTEIAPGIDLRRDVLDQCAAEVAVAADLREMDSRIFRRGPMCAGPAAA